MKVSSKTRGSVYFRLLATFISLTVLVVGLASCISYSMFNRIYIDEIMSSLEKSIQYESGRLQTDIFSRTHTLMQDIAVNASYTEPLCEIVQSGGLNSVTLSNAYGNLSALGKMYNSMAASIIIYCPQMNMLLSSNMGYKQLTVPYNQHYRSFVDLLPDEPGLRMQWVSLRSDDPLPGLQDGSILLISSAQWQGVSTSRNVLIVIALKDDYIQEKLNYIASGDGAAYLIDETGEILCRGGTWQEESPAWREEWGGSLLAGGLASVVSPFGTVHISSPVTSQGWRLVYSAPIDSYASASAEVGRITLLAVAVVLLLGVVFTLAFSRQLYSPVQELMTVVNALQPGASSDEYGAIRTAIDSLSARLSDAERLEQTNRPVIRNMLIHDLLRGVLTMNDPESENLRLSGIELPFANYAVMIVEWCEQDMNRLSAADRSTARLALRELLEENSGRSDRIYTYLPSRMRIVLLINAAEQDETLIERIAVQAREYLARSSVRAMSACGGWTDSLGGVSAVYQTAQLNMELRLMCGEDTLIVSVDQEATDHPSLNDMEMRVIQHIRERRCAEAASSVGQLVELWQKLPAVIGYRSLMRLNAALKDALVRLKSGAVGEAGRLVADPKLAIWNVREYPEAAKALFERVLGGTDSAAASRNDVLFERTVNYINEHIDEDLSLERISGEMHFNPKYFSRLFKEMAGVTLSEYITKRRLKLATEMLLQNSLTIEEISRRVGYGSTQYFTRKFKEVYGLNPREYRLREAGSARDGDDAGRLPSFAGTEEG